MPESVLPPFLKFKGEAAIVGRLLAGYTNLEVGLMHCVSVVRDDFDTTLKTMFRVRSESQRIGLADALGRHHYNKLDLHADFAAAIGAMHHCRKIRNQYAHCVWWDDNSGELAFANLEDIAKKNELLKDLGSLPRFHVDVPLLQVQEAFFVYVDRLLLWINFEGRIRTDKTAQNPTLKPTTLVPPALNKEKDAEGATDPG
jgi:hypothetical protein